MISSNPQSTPAGLRAEDSGAERVWVLGVGVGVRGVGRRRWVCSGPPGGAQPRGTPNSIKRRPYNNHSPPGGQSVSGEEFFYCYTYSMSCHSDSRFRIYSILYNDRLPSREVNNTDSGARPPGFESCRLWNLGQGT